MPGTFRWLRVFRYQITQSLDGHFMQSVGTLFDYVRVFLGDVRQQGPVVESNQTCRNGYQAIWDGDKR